MCSFYGRPAVAFLSARGATTLRRTLRLPVLFFGRRWLAGVSRATCENNTLALRTLKELEEAVKRVQLVLTVDKGIQKGQAVMVCLPPCFEYYVILIACLRGGFCFVPVPTRLATDGNRYQAVSKQARILTVFTL